MERYKVNRVWLDETHVWAETSNGWKAGYPFSQWCNLAKATQEQRGNFFLSRYGIHWPELDEDLCFEGLFADAGLCERSASEDSFYYQS